MDLLRILDAKPEPDVVDEDHFVIDPEYQSSNEYKIATPMSDFQKELMDQIVSLHFSDILRFFERIDDSHDKVTPTQEQIILDSLHTMLDNAQLVASHPYLLIDHYFPKSLTNRDLPKRLAETSGKFQILRDILGVLDSEFNPKDKSDHSKDNAAPINIGIVAKDGKTLDLIDSLCTGSRCLLKRYQGVKVRDSQANQKKQQKIKVNVHLFPSSMEELHEKELPDKLKFDFLILFDITCNLDNEDLKQYIDPARTKIIRLVPIYSVDHIALYYRHQLQDNGQDKEKYDAYLKPIVGAVSVLRDRVGQLPPILKPIYGKNLQYLSGWFKDPVNTPWPLPDMPPIAKFSAKEVERALLTEVKFNFDNDDFMKEEEEANSKEQQPKELNLNFSFGNTKTQMVQHIVRPRYTGKDQKRLDFYEEKRWQKKYLTNPLNSDYYKLTGISKEISQNEILTHTLIYNMTRHLGELEGTNMDAKIYDDTFDTRMQYFRQMRFDYANMARDLKEVEEQCSSKTSEIKSLDLEIDDYKTQLTELRAKIKALIDAEPDGGHKEWLLKDQEAVECQEEISKLKGHLESNKNEDKYMRQEIERADKSIRESTEAKEKKLAQVAELEEKIAQIKADRSGIDERNAKLQKAQSEFDTARKRGIELSDRLDLTLKRLVDASTGRSRHVNYARR